MTEKTENYSAIEAVIKNRKTLKVLADTQSPLVIPTEIAREHDRFVLSALEVAGYAPFHYSRDVDGLAEPWRAYFIKQEHCRTIAREFNNWFSDVPAGNKLPMMLSACSAVVLVNWIPQFRSANAVKQSEVDTDDEHLAASSAMVQNLLLLLTAQGMGTYWSSGGKFNSPQMYERLGISKHEKLLAAIFIEYPETFSAPIERAPGKLRNKRSTGWIKNIEL